jgi:hypothetical protein
MDIWRLMLGVDGGVEEGEGGGCVEDRKISCDYKGFVC